MAIIKQHRPAYFTGFEDAIAKFETVDELLNIDFVKNFSTLPNFHQYSITLERDYFSETERFKTVLMAEYETGFKWWCVGYINDLNFILNLPTWEAKYKKEE